MKRRVVVTGLGAITPVGNDVATTWRSLIEGKSGTAPITKFDASKFPVRFAAEVKGFNALDYMDRKEAKRADQYTQYAIAGARQAMTDARLIERNGMEPDRRAKELRGTTRRLSGARRRQDLSVFHSDVHRGHSRGHRLDDVQRQRA